MFEQFKAYITAHASLTDEELELMRSLCIERKVNKRQLLLHEGEVCRHKVFVVKGLLRIYHVNTDGSEAIMRFAPETWWCVESESYHSQQPSKYNIDALEDSEVILWSRENAEILFARIPAFKAFSEGLITNVIRAGQDRVLMNISYTAEEKYREFVNTFPDVYGRVPLHMIAAYLGVSRETLTRVRRAESVSGNNR